MENSPQPETYVNAQQGVLDLVKPAYEIVKRNWRAFLVVNILALIGGLAANQPSNDATQNNPEELQEFVSELPGLSGLEAASLVGIGAAVVVVVVVMAIIAVFLQTMNTSLQLKASVGKKPTVKELFEDAKKYFWKYLLLSLMMGVLIGLPIFIAFAMSLNQLFAGSPNLLGGWTLTVALLLILVSVIVTVRLYLAPLHLVDKDMKPLEAIKASNAQAKKYAGPVWVVLITLFALILLTSLVEGIIPVFGGLIAALVGIVWSMLPVLRYQQLKLPNYPADKRTPDASIPPSEVTVDQS